VSRDIFRDATPPPAGETDEEFELSANEERAFATLMGSLAAAQRTYDASLTPTERALEEHCSCRLCQWVKGQRQLIAEYEASAGKGE
jgi:hypothetical protein